jgi:UDP-3-O-acyl N-acetylglucosamine deacetylase
MQDCTDSARRRVLIVDDDAGLTGALAEALENDGFQTAHSSDGQNAMRLVERFRPHVMLLDIWVPGMNGFEILRSVRGKDYECRVIMFSGHGTIAMAVRAIQLGAFDYLEKPCSLTRLVESVKRACTAPDSGAAAWPSQVTSQPLGNHRRSNGRSMVRRPQRTLRRSAVGHGLGLQSGAKTGILLEPMPPGSGIVFRNIATGETLPASIDFVASTSFCTTLHKEGVTVRTIEHLMSALHAYGISNLQIQVGDEVPIMDGSAASFCRLIEQCGVIEQEDGQEDFVVDRSFHVGHVDPSTKFILVEPYDGFKVSYRLQYPRPLGVQEFTYEHRSGSSFHLEIAPARTFAFVHEVEKMHGMGLIAGGRLNNVILLGDERIVNNVQLRFPDECVRHKVLDLIGDLYLLGRQLRGHVRANMTGHTENVALVKMLSEAA